MNEKTKKALVQRNTENFTEWEAPIHRKPEQVAKCKIMHGIQLQSACKCS